MPELPETETIARDLNEAIAGRKILAVKVSKADVLREVTSRTFAKRLKDVTIVRSWRRAKLIVTDLSTGDRLVVQPRFTGAMIVENPDLDPAQLAYSTMRLELDDRRALHYCDVRRLGTVSLMNLARFDEYSGALGKEPLDQSFDSAQLSGVLRVTNQPVKKVLMDQSRIAGIGNIYANEALWRAGIDPSRASSTVTPEEAERLRNELVDVLNESIALRGTSFRDYRDAKGERGRFAERLQAYGREGLPCFRCGRRMIGTHAIDGRATVFCATCQT
ncbi:MAG TPA: bifunctional DNA-formamidopyrimidine glycosylase/DNA-(apurinic or apyrimidinic site) lyase [Gemmatimonadaceae bacterium]|nr:bifunctional DNA-formamidopyrimidine glycosylase/DNA-(apurinic or apyrimidinic site) lyase [Gemmatimonadaceae bacterium]